MELAIEQHTTDNARDNVVMDLEDSERKTVGDWTVAEPRMTARDVNVWYADKQWNCSNGECCRASAFPRAIRSA